MSSKASALSAYVFAQRAIWFRLLPMRATWRVRSTSAAAAALAFQAANSTADARTEALTMRRSAIGASP